LKGDIQTVPLPTEATTSVHGTKRTWRDVRFTSAIAGQADINVALGMIDDFTI
jgi:hypothetical protein